MSGLIDVHAHLLFDELLGLAGAVGPRLDLEATGATSIVTGCYRFGIGSATSLNRPPADRVAQLDALGIDLQVVSASPLWYFPYVTSDVVVPFARRYNDLMAEWTTHAPDRLKFLATVPIQDVSAAIAELQRTVQDLGAVGVNIGTAGPRELDDHDLDDFYGACVDLDVPLFLHSTVAGIDGPPGDRRLRRWLQDVTLGYPFEETIAVTTLILGGVINRHPRLDLCLSHGGGATPFLLGRLRDWVATGQGPVSVSQFDHDYGRLWFDMHVHSEQSARLLADVANPERLVFGTNFGGWDSASVDEADALPVDLAGNAKTLLRL